MFSATNRQKLRMKYLGFLGFILFFLPLKGQEKVEVVTAENGKLEMSYLKEGKRDYLVYFTDSTRQKRTNGDLWRRSIEKKKLDGKDVYEFKWDALFNGKVYMETLHISDGKTFAPIFHQVKVNAIGDERIDAGAGVYAYEYKPGKLVPSDTVQGNKALERGVKELKLPVISWEQDLETFPLLPIREVGQKFDVSFFDTNEKEAQFHRYEVVALEDLSIGSDVKVKCWVLENREGSNGHYARFWLTQQSREVLKMEEYSQGRYRYKVLQY